MGACMGTINFYCCFAVFDCSIRVFDYYYILLFDYSIRECMFIFSGRVQQTFSRACALYYCRYVPFTHTHICTHACVYIIIPYTYMVLCQQHFLYSGMSVCYTCNIHSCNTSCDMYRHVCIA